MNEEMNRQEAELNEAALEGVSGGSYDLRDAVEEAGRLCTACGNYNPSKIDCELQHRKDLVNYLLEHGQHSVPVYTKCPYYNR